jgi:hypothetical protein
MYETSLQPLSKTPILAPLLLPILNVQMDNVVGKNKNWFVFYFWSLFVAKGIFREVYMNFMLVGDTYNDIDTLFGR